MGNVIAFPSRTQAEPAGPGPALAALMVIGFVALVVGCAVGAYLLYPFPEPPAVPTTYRAPGR